MPTEAAETPVYTTGKQWSLEFTAEMLGLFCHLQSRDYGNGVQFTSGAHGWHAKGLTATASLR